MAGEAKWIKWVLLAPLTILMWFVVLLLVLALIGIVRGWPYEQQAAVLELTKTVLSGGVLGGIVAGLTLAFKVQARELLGRLATK